MKFTYEGTDSTGAKVTQTVEADDRYAVYDIARTNGHVVMLVKEQTSFSLERFFDVEKINAAISRVKGDELVMVTANIASMLDAGLPLMRALSVIERQSRNPKLKLTIVDIREQINGGASFYQTLEKHRKVFDDLYIAMVRAGEESGNLSGALHTLALQMGRSTALKKQIKGAMVYPIIVIIILVIIGILMMIYVMPSITSTFMKLNVELPTATRVLMNTSNFLVDYTFLAIGGMVGAVAGFIYFLRTRWGKVASSWVIPKLPVIGGMAKETNAARTARTLSSLLSSGVDVIRALQITEEVVQNVFYKKIIAEAAVRVEKGTPLSEVFVEREDLYPILVGEMILVGEETGQISDMLGRLAEFYEEEVKNKTENLSTIIEPLLMVVIGGTVGFFALAMISPIYSISDSIG